MSEQAIGPTTISVERTVATIEELEAANREVNPILRSIVEGLKARPTEQAAALKHIKASFSLTF